MSARWWSEFVAVLFFGAVAGWNLFLVFKQPTWRINEAQYYRVTSEMTRDEVHAILGRPGDCTLLRRRPSCSNSLKQLGLVIMSLGQAEKPGRTPPVLDCDSWASDAGEIQITFEDGRIVHRCFYAATAGHNRDWRGVLERLVFRRR
jgi:hypothetical protein